MGIVFIGIILTALITLLWFIGSLDKEVEKWRSIKPICDCCGKVYSAQKHIHFSNWSCYENIKDNSPSHFNCYQCVVRYDL